MEEDRKTRLKTIRLPDDMRCVITEAVSADEYYFKEVSYYYEVCDLPWFEISMSCISDESGNEYAVDIKFPKEENLLHGAKTEEEALNILNSNLLFKDRVPALRWNMSLR